jgi:hypothetical protein
VPKRSRHGMLALRYGYLLPAGLPCRHHHGHCWCHSRQPVQLMAAPNRCCMHPRAVVQPPAAGAASFLTWRARVHSW